MTTRETLIPAYRPGVHAEYAALRESAPVCRAVAPGGLPVWVVTRHAEAVQALRDPRLVKDPHVTGGFGGRRYPEDLYVLSDQHLLNTEDPEHGHLRRLISPYLAANPVRRLRPLVAAVVQDLLDRIDPASQIDLFADFARLVPVTVIGHVLGMPAGLLPSLIGEITTMLRPRPPTDPDIVRAHRVVAARVEEFVAGRRREPRRRDLTGALIRASDTGEITEHQVTTLVKLVIGAGVVSTATLIANGILAALRDPVLREAPPDQLVEELLRHDPPFAFSTWRFAAAPVELGGARIEVGDVVLVGLAAANRDPCSHTDPDEVRLGRTGPANLAFGGGPHFCLGAGLARMEAEIAIPAVLRHFPRLRLSMPEHALRWHGVLVARDLEALPVEVN